MRSREYSLKSVGALHKHSVHGERVVKRGRVQ